MKVYRTPVRRGRPVRIACVNKTKHVGLGVPFGKLTGGAAEMLRPPLFSGLGLPVKLYNTRRPRPTDWQFLYVDDAADAKGTDGYHDLTITAGRCLSSSSGPCWRTASRQPDRVTRIVRDGDRSDCQHVGGGNGGREFAYEMCDPVEEDTFLVDGLRMSNFVYPAWFEPFRHPRGTKFDHLGLLKSPFSMTKGGYVIVKYRGKVTERFHSKAKARRFAKEQRRGHRSEYRKPRGLRI